MSRSDYDDDIDPRDLAMWRGQVASAIRGRRGQALLRDLVIALDAMPEKRLIAKQLRTANGVCALGCVGAARGLDLESIDPENYSVVAREFDIAEQLAREIAWLNDEVGDRKQTSEERWHRIREWAASKIAAPRGAL